MTELPEFPPGRSDLCAPVRDGWQRSCPRCVPTCSHGNPHFIAIRRPRASVSAHRLYAALHGDGPGREPAPRRTSCAQRGVRDSRSLMTNVGRWRVGSCHSSHASVRGELDRTPDHARLPEPRHGDSRALTHAVIQPPIAGWDVAPRQGRWLVLTVAPARDLACRTPRDAIARLRCAGSNHGCRDLQRNDADRKRPRESNIENGDIVRRLRVCGHVDLNTAMGHGAHE